MKAMEKQTPDEACDFAEGSLTEIWKPFTICYCDYVYSPLFQMLITTCRYQVNL